jgi:hypothetical protein
MEEETTVICFKVIYRFSHDRIGLRKKLVISPGLISHRVPPKYTSGTEPISTFLTDVTKIFFKEANLSANTVKERIHQKVVLFSAYDMTRLSSVYVHSAFPRYRILTRPELLINIYNLNIFSFSFLAHGFEDKI